MYPNQGLTVANAGWTKDSRFFVYLTTQSGGHSPWHHPVFLYSRKKHRFYSLDNALAALGHEGDGCVTGELKLHGTCTLVTTASYQGGNFIGLHIANPKRSDWDRQVTINLGWLEKRLTQSMVSSDRKDRADLAEEIRLEGG